ncbi:MAG: pyridoxamine 5'-phosphate oxidase [Actinomycetota bacterium]|nr:pyridoxamine 5'-phosphate oxidase [Actinomycetota bacterium]
MTDPSAMRRGYLRYQLDETLAPDDWLELFQLWFDEAAGDDAVLEANAMQLATVGVDGRPSVRTVLLKGLDPRGIVFYTNYDSAKAADLAANPYASAVFVWLAHERQVRVSGPTGRIDRVETDEYFASRPRGSQLGAWASPQSAVVASRSVLEQAASEVEVRFEGTGVPTPPHWGGYRLVPEVVEFWQGREDRLHDRLRYRHDPATGDLGWVRERLAP